jgi:FAD-linked oxidoreductase
MINRRRFMANTVLAALWSSLPSLGHAGTRPALVKAPWRNWSGYLSANPLSRIAPFDEDELVAALRSTSGAVRPVGSGHSFSPLVPTDGHLIVLDNLSGLISHDSDKMTAELFAGTRLSDAGRMLNGIGQAMFNLPDIDRQTLAGAVSTATHGTGRDLKSLSGYVHSLRLVTPSGDVLDLDAENDSDLFNAARVSLGSLGIITRIGFKNRAPFKLRSRTWTDKTEAVIDQWDTLTSQWQHFEIMPLLHSDYSFIIAHQETDAPISPMIEEDDGGELLALFDATPVLLRGALIDLLAEGIEPNEGVDTSYQSLTNLRFDRFNEMEYSVPAAEGHECLREILQTIKRQAIDVSIPLEYRLIGEDDAWLSMFYDGPRVSISLHRLAQYDYAPLFNVVEPIFWKYGGRPHWGKVHSLGYAQLRSLYPKFDEFITLQKKLDPQARMLNPHLQQLLGR